MVCGRNLMDHREHAEHMRLAIWLALLALLAYVNVTANKFVLDDKYFLVENYALRQPWLFFSPLFKAIPLAIRPAMFFSLALDFKVWGLSPAGFHLTNLLLHVLNVLLVYEVALRLPGGRFFAPLAGLLFAIHPVHSEAVASLLGRSDLMIMAFFLLGLLAYHVFLREPKLFRRGAYYLLTLFLFGLSCLTKESGIVLPLLLVLSENSVWRSVGPRRGLKAQALSFLPFVGLGLLLIWFRQAVVPATGQTVWGGGAWQTTILMGLVIWKYAVLMIFPAFLSPFYEMSWPTGWACLIVIGGAAVLFGAGGLTVRFRRFPLIPWSFLWILIGLLPVSNIVPIPGTMMAERWLYIPSLGFCIGLAWGVHEILTRSRPALRKALWGFGFVVLTLAVVRIVSWNPVWRDDLSLNQAILRRYPESALAHTNLGNYFYLSGRIREAKEEYLQAFLLKPRSAQVHLNLGNVFIVQGDSVSGLAEFRKAVALDSMFVPAWFALGTAYRLRGDLDSALANFQRALKLSPVHLPALVSAGAVSSERKDYTSAEAYFRRALLLAPDDAVLKAYLARAVELRSKEGK